MAVALGVRVGVPELAQHEHGREHKKDQAPQCSPGGRFGRFAPSSVRNCRSIAVASLDPAEDSTGIVGVSLRQRLRAASSRQIKLAALAVLVIYAVVMLWPYLAATLVRGSAVTAWTNVATAPIPGRTPAELPKIGSAVGPAGVILELVNEQLDPGMVPRAEAALAAARARAHATRGYLDGVQEIDRDRRDLMKLYAGQFRSALDADIAERETRLGMLRTKVAAATQLADRTRAVADRGLRSGDYRDDAQMRLAEAEAELVLERMAVEQAKRRRAAADSGVFFLADGSSPNWAYEHRQDAKTEVKRARLAPRRRRRPNARPSRRWRRCAPTWHCRAGRR